MVNHVAVTTKYKAISKKFHITKSTNTAVVIFVFLKYKWVPDEPADPLPLHCVQGVKLHCISENLMCDVVLQARKVCFNRKESYYSNSKNK